MSETLDFPEITNAPSSTVAPLQAGSTEPAKLDLAKIDLEAVALAKFTKAEADAAAAKKALTGVVHDFSTTTKLLEGKSLRQRLINGPQADMRKMTANLKSKLTAVSKAVGAKMTAVEASFAEAEQLITPQIEAREAEIAEEKRIAAEKEAERIAGIQTQIEIIRSYLVRAQAPDMTSTRIQKGVEMVEAMVIGDEFAELKGAAEEAKRSTLAGMLNLRDLAKAREDEAARLEAQRIENERIAAEQAAQAERLAAQQRALDEQAAKIAAAQKAIDDAKAEAERKEREAAEAKATADAESSAFESWAAQARPTGDVESVQRQWEASPEYHELHGIEYTPAQTPQQVLKAEPETAEATDRGVSATTSPSVGSMGAGQAADAAPSCKTCNDFGLIGSAAQMDAVDCPDCTPAPVAAAPVAVAVVARVFHPAAQALRNEPPTIKLGQINEMIAPFSISTAGLADLGFAATTVKGASLYRESDLQQIKAAAIAHMQGVCMRVAVAA